jgi:hypothetical protein
MHKEAAPAWRLDRVGGIRCSLGPDHVEAAPVSERGFIRFEKLLRHAVLFHTVPGHGFIFHALLQRPFLLMTPLFMPVVRSFIEPLSIVVLLSGWAVALGKCRAAHEGQGGRRDKNLLHKLSPLG